jgi:hypothetical protein
MISEFHQNPVAVKAVEAKVAKVADVVEMR